MDLRTESKTQKYNWPTPAESIGLKTKTKKKYIHSKISRSHRNPKKATTSIFDLPPLFPKTGMISNIEFKRVVECIFKDVLDREEESVGTMLSELKEFVIRTNNYAVVKNKWTGEKTRDLSVRSCLRITSKRLPRLLAPYLETIFCKSFRGKNFIESRLDPTHADLLFYRQKDFFGFHKDQILDFPFEDIPVEPVRSLSKFTETVAYKETRGKWYMYSVILCLDSNLSSQSLRDDGNTIVCLPARSFLENPSYRYKIIGGNSDAPFVKYPSKSLVEKDMCHHVFHHSITPRNFVIFPSNASHASAAITQNGGYKFALKMDLWILVPHKIEEIQVEHYLNVEMELDKSKRHCIDMLRYASYYGNIDQKKYSNLGCRYLEYGPGDVFHSIFGNPVKCSCKRCEPREVEVKHIGENLYTLSSLNKILPRDIIFVIASFLEINNIKTPKSFEFVDNKSFIYRSEAQIALGQIRPNHSTLSSSIGGMYNYRLVLGETVKETPSKKMSTPSGRHNSNNWHHFRYAGTGAPSTELNLFYSGKLKLMIKNYTDYYAFLEDRNRGSARSSGDCICDRVNPWIFFEQMVDEEINNFQTIANHHLKNYDNIVCKCTCLACLKSCVVFGENYQNYSSDEYDDESHCNGDDY